MADERINVHVDVKKDIDHVWECWTSPKHITGWNFATETWICPKAENNPVPGGRFSWRMESADGSIGFDYAGTYNQVIPKQLIIKILDDGRMVKIEFTTIDGYVEVTESFEPENVNPKEMQEQGWQAILDNFRKYCEAQ